MQPVEHWAMADDEKDDRPLRRAGTDETIDESRKRKRLEDCTLPEGFTLVTPRPRQMVIGRTGQVSQGCPAGRSVSVPRGAYDNCRVLRRARPDARPGMIQRNSSIADPI